MKKRTIALIVTLITFSSAAFSDSPSSPAPTEMASDASMTQDSPQKAEDPAEEEDDSTPQGKAVSKASEDSEKRAKRSMWGNIALAAAAVVVAVVAIVVVSNNNGHSSH